MQHSGCLLPVGPVNVFSDDQINTERDVLSCCVFFTEKNFSVQLLTRDAGNPTPLSRDAAVFRSRTTVQGMSHHARKQQIQIPLFSTTKSGNLSQSRRASTRVSRKQRDVSCRNETYYIFRFLRIVYMSCLFKGLFVLNMFDQSASVCG